MRFDARSYTSGFVLFLLAMHCTKEHTQVLIVAYENVIRLGFRCETALKVAP